VSMRHIVICVLSGSAVFLNFFFPQSTRFSKKRYGIWNMYFDFLYDFYEMFLILRRTEQDNVNVHRSAVKYALFLSDFNENWIFSTEFRKIFKYQTPWKSVYWEPSCSMRTDMAKPTVTFRNFANASKNCGWNVRIRLANVYSCFRSCVLNDFEQKQNTDIFFARN
jgi:hypothetical protein